MTCLCSRTVAQKIVSLSERFEGVAVWAAHGNVLTAALWLWTGTCVRGRGSAGLISVLASSSCLQAFGHISADLECLGV